MFVALKLAGLRAQRHFAVVVGPPVCLAHGGGLLQD